jgi:hypothetical protein
MSDIKPASPFQTPGNEAALARSIEDIDRAVDAMFTCGNAICNMARLEAPDVPRLLVSAAVRTLERLLAYYHRRLVQHESGAQPWMEGEQDKLQRQIRISCEDAIETMGEAGATARRILDAMGVKTN